MYKMEAIKKLVEKFKKNQEFFTTKKKVRELQKKIARS